VHQKDLTEDQNDFRGKINCNSDSWVPWEAIEKKINLTGIFFGSSQAIRCVQP